MASLRSSLIRLAASMPQGSQERATLLNAISKPDEGVSKIALHDIPTAHQVWFDDIHRSYQQHQKRVNASALELQSHMDGVFEAARKAYPRMNTQAAQELAAMRHAESETEASYHLKKFFAKL